MIHETYHESRIGLGMTFFQVPDLRVGKPLTTSEAVKFDGGFQGIKLNHHYRQQSASFDDSHNIPQSGVYGAV